ncbi:phosphate ABC transporter substrate-binding protein PstS [Corynebacterium sp.]|uniref:phosphate ABC transporter substrate-binding protein PstS n=1 Tax=Corynebacterium sp. TaxID=1720 RepID=UPI0026DCFC9D|nr:phosphate ABC transporter substrate-binding protein PstS [Corynebacterium sp.]MDO4609844.1 phosphate ABC transporter substrate-binding protein PstS [Corynebacterium sp.]
MTACSESGGGETQVEGLADATGQLQGEGATSQQRAMDHFAALYEAASPGSTLSYNATGSGSGQSQFIAGTTAFAGSDSALDEDQVDDAKKRCGGNDAWHLPMVIGPVAIAYNVEGVDDLVLTPDLVAKIFKGDITEWNDKAIAEANPDAKLPDEKITPVYRSEESGTSENFQRFLKDATDSWDVEPSKSFPKEVGTGAQGSSGVADQVSLTPGSITYVESGFAKDKGLGIAQIDFGSGPVELNAESVNKALSAVEFTGSSENDMVVDTDALFAMTEEGAYPLVLTTYEIVCSSGYDDQTRDLLKNFLTVVLEKGQSQELEDLGYIPVDGDYKAKLKGAVDAIK